MGAVDELQVCLVPLLQTFQQQLVLCPLQLEFPHLGDGGRDGVCVCVWGGRRGPSDRLGKPSSPHVARSHFIYPLCLNHPKTPI